MSQILDAYRGLRLGERWDRAPKAVRWAVMLLVVAFAFYLPYLNILPFAYIRTDLHVERLRLGERAVPDRRLHDRGRRPQRRDRPGRPARPRLRRLLRPRRLLGRAVRIDQLAGRRGDRRASSASSEEWAVPFAVCIPIAIMMSPDRRRVPGRADPAAARRLPRHRDARLRRDHPHHRPQPRQRHQRRRRHHQRAGPARSRRSTVARSSTRSTPSAGTGWRSPS